MPNDISEEDKALFRQAVNGVKPIKTSQKLSLPSSSIKQRNSQLAPPPSPKQSYFISSYYTEEVQAESVLTYSSPGFPTNRFRELKLGKIPWEGVLDLHGLRPEAAEKALIKFIQHAVEKQKRLLLIIHGKGGQRQAPVLKNLVNHWLPQFPSVAAFHSALPRDGGNGAVYVLLKRKI